ncbi:lipopolysaccharide biosynthesis protein [Sphingosinicella humi]|uniref:lipopolysaccharide biosynthesis protein n=1 Tax=Allosphingosinicella humi TaxID=2068657 RepID=UPI001304F985|nr:oligosaccharide flippase family protein [Sphingosinicella humi]
MRILAERFPFITNVALLTSGTIVGQAITVLVLPVLTRFYSPDAFGLLGIYMSVLMMISPAACARFELAIPLPQRDEDAINLLALSIIAATVVSAVLGIITVAGPSVVAAMLRQPRIEPYLWMIPLGIWFTALYSAIQLWSIRKGRYRDVARTQLIRAIGGSGGQVGFGVAAWSPFGLLFGYLLYSGLGSFGLGRLLWLRERKLLHAISWTALRRNLREQRRFPLFSVPESLCDAAANNLPLLLIASIGGAREAGFMLLAQRITSIPVALIGTNISRVYLAEGAGRHRRGELGAFTRKVMRHLLFVGAGPFLILAIVAPIAFAWVFGSEWDRAGVMVTWLVPSMMLQFLASPVSTIMAVTQKQHVSFLLQLYGLVTMIAAIGLAAAIAPDASFEFFAVASASYYAAYVIVVLHRTWRCAAAE